MVNKEPPPVSAPEEKRPSLTLEELEAKQGNSVQDVVTTIKATTKKLLFSFILRK